jgi:hypothetical protein
MLDRGLESSFETSLCMETESVIATLLSKDVHEGTSAFFEGRKPAFTGK